MKIEESYRKFTRSKISAIIGFFLILIVLQIISVSIGASSVGMRDSISVLLHRLSSSFTTSTFAEVVVFDLRLPRVLFAGLCGMGLAISGSAMQGVLRNPLVSPYILGISSGAAFGASLAIALGIGFIGAGKYLVMTNAFIFALAAGLLVLGIARLKGESPEVVILAGVAIGFLFSALSSILQYISSEEELRSIVFWMMGSLWGVEMDYIFILFPVVLIGFILLMRHSWNMNTLSAGEEVAKSLGVNVGRTRFFSFSIASLITASIISFTGVIGFVGLMAPHMSRVIVGSDHRFLLPMSAIVGAILLLAADTAARSIVQPVEIPVGIMTALIGVPFFLYLLLKRRKDWWS